MASRKEAVARGTRHPLWNKELFREEVERGGGESINAICRKWSTDPTKVQGLTNDVGIWRKEDRDLDVLCKQKFGVNAPNGTGRPSLETEDPEWRLKFCEEYLKTKSRVKAAEVTPYAYSSIMRKMDPNKTEYDRTFTEMVAQTEARLLDRAEQILHESLELEPSHRNKAWIAKEILKARDRQRWGDKVDVHVAGTVQHTLDRGRALSELAERQEKFFEKTRPQLEANTVIDVEIVGGES
jgi:hypothetical protein